MTFALANTTNDKISICHFTIREIWEEGPALTRSSRVTVTSCPLCAHENFCIINIVQRPPLSKKRIPLGAIVFPLTQNNLRYHRRAVSSHEPKAANRGLSSFGTLHNTQTILLCFGRLDPFASDNSSAYRLMGLISESGRALRHQSLSALSFIRCLRFLAPTHQREQVQAEEPNLWWEQ